MNTATRRAPELEAYGWFVRTKRTTDEMGGWLIADCSSSLHGAEYARMFAATPELITTARELLRILTRNDVPEAEKLNIADRTVDLLMRLGEQV